MLWHWPIMADNSVRYNIHYYNIIALILFKFLGIPVTVVMPVIAPIMKIENCKRYGAKIIIHGQNIGEAKELALKLGKEQGFLYVNG